MLSGGYSSGSKSGSGYCGSMDSRVSRRISLTTRSRYQRVSAGTTYHGRGLRRGPLDGDLEGVHVVVPELALVEVAGVELPVLVGPAEAAAEALELVVLRDVQHHLDHARAGVGEERLEVPDVLVAPLDDVGLGPPVDADDQDVLVVRPVEHADHPLLRRLLVDAPQEVVPELLLRRRLERRDADALRVHRPEHALRGRVLAPGVHGLEHEQDGLLTLGIERLLEVARPVDVVVEPVLGLVLRQPAVARRWRAPRGGRSRRGRCGSGRGRG